MTGDDITGDEMDETIGADSGSDIDDELAADDGSLSNALRTLLQAPEDIEHRVADTVSGQLLGRSTAGTALDLVGLGVRTLAFFLTASADGADRNEGHLAVPVDRREAST